MPNLRNGSKGVMVRIWVMVMVRVMVGITVMVKVSNVLGLG